MHNGYYSAIKKKKTMYFARKWIELEIIMITERRQTQKEKCFIFSLMSGI
jgi:hypothetical protein